MRLPKGAKVAISAVKLAADMVNLKLARWGQSSTEPSSNSSSTKLLKINGLDLRPKECKAKAAQQDAQLQEAQQQAQLQPQQQATAREEVQQAQLQEVQLQEAQQALLSQLSQQQAREEVQQAQQQEPQQQQQDAQQRQEQDEVARRIAKAHRGYANSAHKNSARSCANKVVKFAGLSEEKFRKMQKFSRRPGAAHYVREAEIANTAAQAQVQLAKGILRQIEKYKKQEEGGPLAAATAAKAAWEVVKSSHQHVCDLLLSVKELPATLPQ